MTLLAGTACSPSPETASDAYSRDVDGIARLRAEREYDKALIQCRGFLEERQRNPKAPRYQTSSLEVLQRTLAEIVALSPADQTRMARADTLDFEIEQRIEDDEYELALTLVDEQERIRNDLLGSGHPETLSSRMTHATVLDLLGRPDEAEAIATDVLEQLESLYDFDHPAIADGKNVRAVILHSQGRYDEADVLYRESLVLTTELFGEGSVEQARRLNDLGCLLIDSGEYAESLELLHQALTIREKHEGYEPTVETLGNLGTNRYYAYQPDEAIPYLDRAMQILRARGRENSLVAAEVLNSLAACYFDKHEIETSIHYNEAALAIRESNWPDGHPKVGRSLLNLAIALFRVERYDEAESMAGRARGVFEKYFEPGHPDVIGPVKALADFRWLRGDYEGALPHYREVAGLYAQAWGVTRALWTDNKDQTPYAELAICLLKTGHAEEAWPFVEQDHARSLVDALQASEWSPLTEAEEQRDRALRDAEEQAADRWSALKLRASKEGGDSGNAAERLVSARNELERCRAEWRRFQLEMASRYPASQSRPRSLSDVQAVLSPDEAILGWSMVDAGYPTAVAYSYVIRHTGPVLWDELAFKTDREESSPPEDFLQAIGDREAGERLQSIGRELWDYRLASAMKRLEGVSRVVVVPAWDMLGIPLEAVSTPDGGFVYESMEVSYAPSATVFAWIREQASRRGSAPRLEAALVVADPPYSDAHLEQASLDEDVFRDALDRDMDTLMALPPLRHSRREAAALDRLSHGHARLLIGPDAREPLLEEIAASGDLQRFGLIHVATHAFIDSESADRSFMVLSLADHPAADESGASRSTHDGLIEVSEILRSWELNARLVTLSGCETGLGRLAPGEGYLGFVNAFLQKGARATLVSLWPVNDHATSIFMVAFYEALFAGSSMEQAATSARNHLRGFEDETGVVRYDHPVFWAPFVLIGATESTEHAGG